VSEKKDLADRARHDEMVTKLIEGFLVMNMTKRQAAAYAGFSENQANRILNSDNGKRLLAETREQLARKYNITKERVIKGMVDAIDQAKLLGEPGTQISGWKELGKMQGLYEPQVHRVEYSADEETLRKQIREMSQDQLIELATAKDPTNIIDGEFEEVPRD